MGVSSKSRSSRSGGRIRYAVAGLGYIAQSAILPAFKNAGKNSELTTLVSDDPVKLRALGRKYGVHRLFDYQHFEEALREVDAVFIALPNTLHREYTERAAALGVHVLCEKPLALTVRDCEGMIEACRRAGVRLMTAYRLHFERANLEAVEIARKRLGDLRLFTASFGNNVKAGNLRLQAGEGGPLFDIGIYCINAARFIFRAEPIEVWASEARNSDPRFFHVPETVSAMMRFPGGRMASFSCTFGAPGGGWYEVTGRKGTLRVDPAYEIAEELRHTLTINERSRTKAFKARDQFAPEILYFSECILKGRVPEPSGKEGLADVRVMAAIERSIALGRAVRVDPVQGLKRPSLIQEIRRPVLPKAPLVHAEAPSVA